MKIIGVNTGHDGGCALSLDGKVKIAISEERLTRKKMCTWMVKFSFLLFG